VEIEQNVSLAQYTTLGIGGPARWFAQAQSEADVTAAVEFARARSLPLFVLGGGSNLLVADAGFPGCVVQIALRGVQQQTDGDDVLLTAAAGEEWDSFVAATVEQNCAGLECLSGIPGTVGGTPVQNVGAYGQEVSAVLERVRALDRKTLRWVEFDNAACQFAYRSSRFNSVERERYIVTRVTYRLRRGGEPHLVYKDVAQYFAGRKERPTLAEVRTAVRAIRQRKGMLLVAGDPDCKSAGSFFKNPVIAAEQAERLRREFAAMPHFSAGAGHVKIPAAWLIEQVGFTKGAAMGAAGISSKHTLALVNRGGATAAEMLALRDAIRARVQERFGIALEQEPVCVGTGLSA
jgi:UDP-N-acetylmuramate dehydrogenase